MKVKHFCFVLILAAASLVLINKAAAGYNEYSVSSGYASGGDSYNNSMGSSLSVIPVNYPLSLSYKSKAEVFSLRKAAVQKSIFKNPDYQPSDEVFGQIEDGKPWISMNSCLQEDTRKTEISGPSEEARFIMNPTALVMINYPFGNWCKAGEYEPHENVSSIKYDSSKNEIIVTYEILNFPTIDNDAFYEFYGLNARDLGYKYGYIDKSKSTFDLQFVNPKNIGNSIVEFQNYLHTGGSCKHETGCNNGSPFQPMLHFENPHRNNTEYNNNKEIYIKLWKNRPNSVYDKPDIVEKIVIEQS